MKEKFGFLKKYKRSIDPRQTWLKWGEKKPKLVKSRMQKGR
jgi:hypothetical protein